MYQDYRDLLSAFQSHGVKYLAVGSFAKLASGTPQDLADVDAIRKAAELLSLHVEGL